MSEESLFGLHTPNLLSNGFFTVFIHLFLHIPKTDKDLKYSYTWVEKFKNHETHVGIFHEGKTK